MKITDIKALEKIANNIRIDIINQVYEANSGHPGGALSSADILSVLYFNQMNINEKEPNSPTRDRFILSKGHCSPALYATLAEKGDFEKEKLNTFRKMGSNLQGHPDMKNIPGVDMSTGSLGQGLSVAVGMAIASKMDREGCRIYCLLGDGEIDEGQIWEPSMAESKNKLDNMCVILDNNGLQLDGKIEEVAGLTNIEGKIANFGFKVINVDGHNISNLIDAFDTAKQTKGVPTIIIAKTIKGKGVSFMEGKAEWHGKAPKAEEYEKAIEELKGRE